MSRGLFPVACALACLIAAAAAALANDSVAETAAGGLVLRQSRDIDMVSEDLYVSAAAIRVRYVFRNRSPRPVTVTVAFPMPDRELITEYESEVAWPADFRTMVNGRPVAMQVERRAMALGVDQSAPLARLNIPIVPEGGRTVGAIGEMIARLPRPEQQNLARLGLIDADSFSAPEGQVIPAWTVKETWHWRQAFPARRDLAVEHAYTPGVGGTAGVPLASPDYRGSEDGRRSQAEYCTGGAFLAALDRMVRRAGRDDAGYPMEQRIRYILTTGGNWRAPIGDFRLVVDKGRSDAIVSFCGEGVRRISPTRFEVRRRNWRPDRDLAVLIVAAQPNDR